MLNTSPVPLGTCTVPDGKRGPWTIDTFTLTEDEVFIQNLRSFINGWPEMMLQPGRYRRLRHAQRGVVMSTVPGEVDTHRLAYERATGRVLVAGLGLGMLVEALLAKPDVSSITVVEVDPHVIALVAPHFAGDSRFSCVNADIHDFTLGDAAPFDFAWFDVWDDICEENLPAMIELRKRGLARASACWSEPQALRNKQRRVLSERRAA